MIRRSSSLAALSFLLVAAATKAETPRLPDGAPYCAAPGARPLFVSPMGAPFRNQAGKPYPAADWFAGADRDQDGTIDRAEFVRDADLFFKTLDRDHDGKLEPEEVIAYERDVAPEIALYGPRSRDVITLSRGRPRNGESNYGGPMGAGRYTWLNIPEPVASTDEDGDRTVSAREFATAAGQRFDLLDSAGRGRLRLADLGKTPFQQALEGPCRPRPKPKKRPPEKGFGPESGDPFADPVADAETTDVPNATAQKGPPR